MSLARAKWILLALAALVPAAIALGLYSNTSRSRLGAAIVNEASNRSQTACYSAATETQAVFCGRTVTSAARMLRCGQAMWRVEYLSAPATGILTGSDGDIQWRLVPGRDVVIRSASTPDDPRRLMENYRARHVGYEKVAGRPVHVVNLIDARGRLARRLFVDRERFVVLRSQVFDRRGRLVGETTIQQIHFLPQMPVNLFQIPSDYWPPVAQKQSPRECAVSTEALGKAAGFQVAIPRWLPESYTLKAACMLRCAHSCGCRVVHLRYSDGIRSLSVFETNKGHHASCPFNLEAQRGRTMSKHPVQYGPGTAFADLEKTPFIIAFGDLPGDQLEKVVRSAR